jgi:TniQ
MKRISSAIEGWDYSELPPRAQFRGGEPAGAGSGLIESASSYLMRLAAEHELPPGVVIIDSIGPALGRPKAVGRYHADAHYFTSILSTSPGSVNGRDAIARLFVMALESLTKRDDLQRLTLLPWARVLAKKGLMRPEQAYCPACLQEWQDREDAEPYYPLIWSISSVRSCGIHRIPLRTVCPEPTCQAIQLPLTFWSRPGYCSKLECGTWLGAALPEPEISNEADVPNRGQLDWDTWVWQQATDLLATSAIGTEQPTGVGIAEAISGIINSTTDGDGARFGRMIGIAKSVVCDWRAGRVLPTLGSALKIAAAGGCHLTALLYGRVEPSQRAAPRCLPDHRETHRVLPWEALRLALLGAIDNPGSKTFKAILADLKLDRRSARARYEELCLQAIQAGRLYRKQRQRDRLADDQQRVRLAVTDLRAAGIPPRKRRVQQIAGTQIREPGLVRAWHEAVAGD